MRRVRRQKRAVADICGTSRALLHRCNLLTPRLQAARDRNIPILTEAWVHACAARGEPLASEESQAFLLPPFAGLRICVTGLDIGAPSLRARAACAAS